MNTAKHSKKWNLQLSQRKPFSARSKHFSAYISTILFASWLGTYLDLYFVGKQWYSFPVRPYSNIFTINIAFTLLGLPILTTFFLYFIEKMKTWKKGVFIVTISLIMMLSEKQSEAIGWFVHNDQWKHSYSFFGYVLFMTIIWKFYRWMSSM
ncbi:CBO0543 family protein [Paranoxybacillus vitaminiphilus]|uniref:CBO0543 family protein n=1 Tax=Paranoxybacillus vitaminiphilus TaxID=581036 RepID=UPI000DBA143D|nr:CBO0543 family protein [Anoxybacillus vitaminiphilus]